MYEYYDSTTNAAAQENENKKVNLGLSPLPTPHITGLKLAADVAIGSLTLNTIDENGVVWVMTDLEGWWQQAEPELPSLRRGWGDGDYDAVGRYGARNITLTGSFLTQDPSQVAAARDKLIRATNLVRTADWLIINESPVAKAAYVRLSGAPQIETISARGRTNFSVGFKAADPIKYEWVEGAANNFRTAGLNSGGITVNNLGNTPVPVVFELFGPVSASAASPVRISRVGGGSIAIVDSIVSGQTLEIDSMNREVLLIEGESVLSGRYKTATLLDWIYLQPGPNTLSYNGSGSCRILYRSGWIG
jgi:hypothetical protein